MLRVEATCVDESEFEAESLETAWDSPDRFAGVGARAGGRPGVCLLSEAVRSPSLAYLRISGCVVFLRNAAGSAGLYRLWSGLSCAVCCGNCLRGTSARGSGLATTEEILKPLPLAFGCTAGSTAVFCIW